MRIEAKDFHYDNDGNMYCHIKGKGGRVRDALVMPGRGRDIIEAKIKSSRAVRSGHQCRAMPMFTAGVLIMLHAAINMRLIMEKAAATCTTQKQQYNVG